MNWIKVLWGVWVVSVLLFIYMGFIYTPEAHSKLVRWQTSGASTFGGHCESGTTGYRGAYLPAQWRSFAELGMGNALGGLPNKAKIRVLYPKTHRRMTLTKNDIGLGGPPIGGVPRGIDIWHRATQYLAGRYASCYWSGVVKYRRIG